MTGVLRRTGRVVGKVLWFPFRVVGWILRAAGRAVGACVEFVCEFVGELVR